MNDSFVPVPLLRNAHVQTVLASSRIRALGRNPMADAAREMILDCQGGVRLQGFHSPQPKGRGRGLVILLHGWEGNCKSSYILGAGRHMYAMGCDVFRLNFRDHGQTHHLNKGVFLSILLDEVLDGVRQAAALSGDRPVFLAGFSLGGNFALRIAARCADHPMANLRQVMAVSPVVSPNKACDAIDGDALIKWYFMKKWKRSLRIKKGLFPDYAMERVLGQGNLRDMTQALLEIHDAGYTDARDYFNAYALTNGLLKKIRVPTLIVTAKDDPVIPVEDFYGLDLSPAVKMIIHRHGGHNAFLRTLSRTSWTDGKMAELFGAWR